MFTFHFRQNPFFWIFLLSFMASCRAATWFVYTDQAMPGHGGDWENALPHIGDAVDLSAPGDTILVGYVPRSKTTYRIVQSIAISHPLLIKSGQYKKDFHHDHAVSEPADCIIDAQNLSRIFHIRSGDSLITADNTIITGLTFYRGNATFEESGSHHGGAILISDGASPLIRHCIFDQNSASTAIPVFSGHGGAVSCTGDHTSPTLSNNTFTGNLASSRGEGRGGAIHIDSGATPLVFNNRFEKNVASRSDAHIGRGGAVCIADRTTLTEFRENVFQENTASINRRGYGGALCIIRGASANLQNNTLRNNNGSLNHDGFGGGIACCDTATQLRLSENLISGNVAGGAGAGYGGGLYITFGSQVDCTHNNFTQNAASASDTKEAHGGAICCQSQVPGVFDRISIRENTITENYAGKSWTGYGGAVAYLGDTPAPSALLNNILRDNVAVLGNAPGAFGRGGAIYIQGSSPLIRNNTFIDHFDSTVPNPQSKGAVLYTQIALPDTAIRNNVFTLNADAKNPDSACLYSEQSLTIRNNAIFGYNHAVNHRITSERQISENPRIDMTDYSLLFDSPCIDAGYDTLNGIHTDLTKANGWFIDIGAREYFGMEMSRRITGAGLYHFGSLVRSRLNVQSVVDTLQLTLSLQYTEPPRYINKGIRRWYHVTCQGNDSISAELTLSYHVIDLRDENESQLRLWHFNETLNSWDGPFFTKRDTINNTVSGMVHRLRGGWIITDATDLVALPVSFISIRLEIQDQGLQIRWQTQSMVDVLGFHVLRSENQGEFQRITERMIPSGGNHSGQSNFVFLDENTKSGRSYAYQIEWINADGSSEFSHAESITTRRPYATQLNAICPNPFNHRVRMDFELHETADVAFTIYDLTGRRVYQKFLPDHPPGQHQTFWEGLSHRQVPLPSGAYLIHFSIGAYSEIRKAVLLR